MHTFTANVTPTASAAAGTATGQADPELLRLVAEFASLVRGASVDTLAGFGADTLQMLSDAMRAAKPKAVPPMASNASEADAVALAARFKSEMHSSLSVDALTALGAPRLRQLLGNAGPSHRSDAGPRPFFGDADPHAGEFADYDPNAVLQQFAKSHEGQ